MYRFYTKRKGELAVADLGFLGAVWIWQPNSYGHMSWGDHSVPKSDFFPQEWNEIPLREAMCMAEKIIGREIGDKIEVSFSLMPVPAQSTFNCAIGEEETEIKKTGHEKLEELVAPETTGLATDGKDMMKMSLYEDGVGTAIGVTDYHIIILDTAEGEAPVTVFDRKSKKSETYSFDELSEEALALREQAENVGDSEDIDDISDEIKKELISSGLIDATYLGEYELYHKPLIDRGKA